MQVNTGIYRNGNENNDSKRQNLDKKSYPNKAQLFLTLKVFWLEHIVCFM